MNRRLPSDEKLHPMRVVRRRTGLSASVLRAWERRYEAVTPGRSDGGQRLYSEDDVQRLVFLSQLVDQGQSISRVAALETPVLEEMVRRERERSRGGSVVVANGNGDPKYTRTFVEAAMEAVRGLAPDDLAATLTRAALSLNATLVVEAVIAPLLQRIGDAWEEDSIGSAHEHVSTPVIRRFLEWLISNAGVERHAPAMLVGTPSGYLHELGAMLAAATASTVGWRSLILGPDLPAQEIAAAAREAGAAVVAISAVYPPGEELARELGLLRKLLPGTVPLLVGGAAATKGRARLEGLGVEVLGDLELLRDRLMEVRKGAGPGSTARA